MRQRLKKLVNYTFEKEHKVARTIRLAGLGAHLNVVLALSKMGLGIYSLSLFLCVNGLYNGGIAFAKYLAIQNRSPEGRQVEGHQAEEQRVEGQHGEEQLVERQRTRFRRIGLILFLASVVYLIYCADMALSGKGNVNYDLITALAIATFTFAEIGTAVYGIIAARKSEDLMLVAAKRISLVTALISLVLTQSALLGLEETPDAARYCGWVGLVFGAASAAIGLHMALGRRARRQH